MAMERGTGGWPGARGSGGFWRPGRLGGRARPVGIVAATNTFGGEDEGRFDPHVLTSADATTWSVQSVSELLDEPGASVGQPVVSGDQAVVPVAPIRPRGPGHQQQVALVATLG